MQVRVLFFGTLKELLGKGSETLALAEGATMGDVLAHYEKSHPKLKVYLPSLAMAINSEYAAAEERLAEGDEVALLPPVSGGKDEEARRAADVSLVEKEIDTAAVLRAVKAGEDGAVAVFEGIVRNHSRGRRTLFLEYEAYAPMALAQMEELAETALERFAVREVAMVHRVGRLEIGETSVLIAVASAHRAAAFEACRWLIDTLKKKVPIWKKEHFEDGAVWADGEPFPEEIPTPAVAKPPRPASQ
jgi:molybdopterin converting factor subunit 1